MGGKLCPKICRFGAIVVRERRAFEFVGTWSFKWQVVQLSSTLLSFPSWFLATEVRAVLSDQRDTVLMLENSISYCFSTLSNSNVSPFLSSLITIFIYLQIKLIFLFAEEMRLQWVTFQSFLTCFNDISLPLSCTSHECRWVVRNKLIEILSVVSYPSHPILYHPFDLIAPQDVLLYHHSFIVLLIATCM